jgi:hypothetical protein
MRLIWLVLMIVTGYCAATSVAARELYRCRGGDGALVFRDTPCESGTVQTGTLKLPKPVDSAPGDDRHSAAERRRIAAWEESSRRRLPASLGGSDPPTVREPRVRRSAAAPARGVDRCTQARTSRDAAYTRADSPGFDERRRLQDAIDRACGLR